MESQTVSMSSFSFLKRVFQTNWFHQKNLPLQGHILMLMTFRCTLSCAVGLVVFSLLYPTSGQPLRGHNSPVVVL